VLVVVGSKSSVITRRITFNFNPNKLRYVIALIEERGFYPCRRWWPTLACGWTRHSSVLHSWVHTALIPTAAIVWYTVAPHAVQYPTWLMMWSWACSLCSSSRSFISSRVFSASSEGVQCTSHPDMQSRNVDTAVLGQICNAESYRGNGQRTNQADRTTDLPSLASPSNRFQRAVY
jgi:hypothetical protein